MNRFPVLMDASPSFTAAFASGRRGFLLQFVGTNVLFKAHTVGRFVLISLAKRVRTAKLYGGEKRLSLQMISTAPPLVPAVLHCAEELRLQTNGEMGTKHQREWGQYFTGAKLASWMASWFDATGETVRLLDAGAGVGSLSAAYVSEICARTLRPRSLDIVTYEADPSLIPSLHRTLVMCEDECERAGVEFRFEIVNADFICEGVAALDNRLFADPSPLTSNFDCAFLNPPYRKISSGSQWRRALSLVGIETSNLYAAFVWLATRLLKTGGELVAITPRSWCNGPYFKPLRMELLETMRFRRFHVFESRREAFSEGDVLQENIIFHGVKGDKDKNYENRVSISSGSQPDEGECRQRIVAQSEVFRAGDPNAFVYLEETRSRTGSLQDASSLAELELSVSTGRVVDFRAKSSLRAEATEDGEHLAPLIYPLHFREGQIEWPRPKARKPNALAINEQTQKLLCPAGVYVLVKRFSSKEQKKRVCAAVFDSLALGKQWQDTSVGFENHLNYFHLGGAPLPLDTAMGLAVFLNSTWIDELFRSFNGHTQVNATDLRSLPYPSRQALQALGTEILANKTGLALPSQSEIDALIDALLIAN